MDDLGEKTYKKPNKYKKIALYSGIFICLSVVIYVVFLGSKMYSAWDNIHEEREGAEQSIERKKPAEDNDPAGEGEIVEEKEQPPAPEPFTMLLMGVDAEDGDMSGRSDVLIVAVVDIEGEKISLLSIPRDTYVQLMEVKDSQLINHGYDKINHGYFFDLNIAINTVEQFLEIPIDYYATVNFDAVVDFVDVIGGLEIDVEKEMIHRNAQRGFPINIKEGEQVLVGEEALYYARFRKDAEGDFGRNRRQQQIIREVINQSVSFRTVSKLTQMVDIVGDNFRTDMPFKQIISLAPHLSTLQGSDVETISMEGIPFMLDGTSYVRVEEDELERVKEELQLRLYPELP